MNERIRDLSSNLEVPQADVTRYLCECGDVACFETVELSVDEYGQGREDVRLVLVADGHDRADDEVVLRSEHYRFVIPADPRGDDAPSSANLEAALEDLRAQSEAIRAELYRGANGLEPASEG